ncbi:TrbC family F-type conjugative pilus assembly protein [Desulfopila sp. IMCC35008]|uniref:TrbC family F-type conjugative pilus assembly protein n=1 Tax=Desulfopila sp. IMCC35008 TaxID=2653858 RepID=UPI001F0FF89E|nr:TrbC family F-type conjugative pilus assembly protein [Desulfopila sp. IMCC35008]
MLRIMIMLLLSTVPTAADELEKSVQQAMEQARKDAAKIEIPANKHEDEGMKAAQESASLFNSPEFQEKLQCEKRRIREEVFADYTPDAEEKDTPITGKLSENEKVYLFISSSIPDETINTYLAAIEGLEEPGISILMKGFVPGQRGRYLTRITQKDRNCIDRMQQENPVVCERFDVPIRIQPSLFDKYDVTRAPAVVYEREGKAWKITGDAGLDYLLEQINREAKSPHLSHLVTTLQGMKYE